MRANSKSTEDAPLDAILDALDAMDGERERLWAVVARVQVIHPELSALVAADAARSEELTALSAAVESMMTAILAACRHAEAHLLDLGADVPKHDDSVVLWTELKSAVIQADAQADADDKERATLADQLREVRDIADLVYEDGMSRVLDVLDEPVFAALAQELDDALERVQSADTTSGSVDDARDALRVAEQGTDQLRGTVDAIAMATAEQANRLAAATLEEYVERARSVVSAAEAQVPLAEDDDRVQHAALAIGQAVQMVWTLIGLAEDAPDTAAEMAILTGKLATATSDVELAAATFSDVRSAYREQRLATIVRDAHEEAKEATQAQPYGEPGLEEADGAVAAARDELIAILESLPESFRSVEHAILTVQEPVDRAVEAVEDALLARAVMREELAAKAVQEARDSLELALAKCLPSTAREQASAALVAGDLRRADGLRAVAQVVDAALAGAAGAEALLSRASKHRVAAFAQRAQERFTTIEAQVVSLRAAVTLGEVDSVRNLLERETRRLHSLANEADTANASFIAAERAAAAVVLESLQRLADDIVSIESPALLERLQAVHTRAVDAIERVNVTDSPTVAGHSMAEASGEAERLRSLMGIASVVKGLKRSTEQHSSVEVPHTCLDAHKAWGMALAAVAECDDLPAARRAADAVKETQQTFQEAAAEARVDAEAARVEAERLRQEEEQHLLAAAEAKAAEEVTILREQEQAAAALREAEAKAERERLSALRLEVAVMDEAIRGRDSRQKSAAPSGAEADAEAALARLEAAVEGGTPGSVDVARVSARAAVQVLLDAVPVVFDDDFDLLGLTGEPDSSVDQPFEDTFDDELPTDEVEADTFVGKRPDLSSVSAQPPPTPTPARPREGESRADAFARLRAERKSRRRPPPTDAAAAPAASQRPRRGGRREGESVAEAYARMREERRARRERVKPSDDDQ
ncbi:MAG: hypothetical protein ACJA00_000312 [Myxococcota bacterium]